MDKQISPSSRLYLRFTRRIKFTILPIIILSIVAFYFAREYYAEKPRFYLGKSKLFPISSENNSQNPAAILGFSTPSTSSDFYNLTELVDSRTIREEVAKRYALINGAEVPVYKMAIEDYNKDPKNGNDFELSTNLAENIIHGGEALKTLISIETNESNFVTLTTKSYNQDFAVAMANELIDILSDFYVKFNAKPLNNSFANIARTKDSLEYELDRYETAYAKYLDENKFIVKAEQNITEKRLLRKLTTIETALTTVSARYYSSKDELDNNKPILKVLDRPMKPLKFEQDSYKFHPYAIAIIVFLLLLMLANSDIIIRYINESMAAQREKILSQES